MAKFKKGSKEAKAFMAKLRAAKSGAKKKKKVFKTRKLAVKHVNKLRTKKSLPLINGEKHTDIKSHNYKITIGSLKNDYLESIKERIKHANILEKFLIDLKTQLKNKSLTIEQKNKIKKHIIDTKKMFIDNKKQISLLKKHI